MSKPVLLVPGHPNSAALWPRLAEHYRLCFLYPQAEQFAASLDVAEVLHLQQFITPDAHEAALNETARLTAQVMNQLGAIGQRVAGLVGPGGPHELNGQFPLWFGGFTLHHFRERLVQLKALETLALNEPLAGCVTHEDVTSETRTLVLFCRQRGLPTIHVPHANCHLRPDGGPDIHRTSVCDWIAAAGPAMREFYISNGYPAERIVVTGAPYWDKFYEDELPGRAESREALGLAAEDRVICYAGTWAQTTGLRGGWEQEINAGLTAVLDLAKAWGARLIVKVHPSDAPAADEAYAQILRAAQVGGLVTRAHGNYVLRASDVLVAQGPSNLCIEAAITGLPSVYLQTEGFDFAHERPYRCEPEDLPAAAQRALESTGDPQWQAFIRQYNAVHPAGGAVERVVEMVREQCPPGAGGEIASGATPLRSAEQARPRNDEVE